MFATGELIPTSSPRQPEPSQSEQATPRVLTILAHVLEKLVARNDRLLAGADGGKSLNAFHGVRAPNISILKYLERLFKYTDCSPSCFVVGYVYIDRLIHKYPDSLLVSLNVHRLLVTSILVASKMLDDVAPEQCILRQSWGSEQRRTEQAGNGAVDPPGLRRYCNLSGVRELLCPPGTGDAGERQRSED
ncbi:unnamed protein product [Linum tenue]|uniref:Cyclin n=1 Tax=Linum tenue TaxID=586396 RepID=A0AAV0R036_9ROSI|nr:unnamed protein product [Linum tenue]